METREFFHKLGVWLGLNLTEERESELYDEVLRIAANRKTVEPEEQ